MPADVVIFEGILTLAMTEVRELLHMKLFVDTDDDVRLARRIRRDTCDRGRDVHGVLEQYTKFVKPMFDQFVSPSKRYADVIIPWAAGDNGVAIDLIVQHIRSKLGQDDLRRIYHNLKLLPSNFQIRGMHTIIRDRSTGRNDFVFYADRLIRLIVEHGLGYLPFTDRSVATPTGADYHGVAFSNRLCGVSIIRSGESMENALRACCKGVKIGKILIQREGEGGPRIIYEKLPLDIARRYVLLLDPILASGNSAIAAIDLLLAKGVDEERILFITLIAAPQGIMAVCARYPSLTLVVSEIDSGLSAEHVVLPGCGDFGDRYFGTRVATRLFCSVVVSHHHNPVPCLRRHGLHLGGARGRGGGEARAGGVGGQPPTQPAEGVRVGRRVRHGRLARRRRGRQRPSRGPGGREHYIAALGREPCCSTSRFSAAASTAVQPSLVPWFCAQANIWDGAASHVCRSHARHSLHRVSFQTHSIFFSSAPPPNHKSSPVPPRPPRLTRRPRRPRARPAAACRPPRPPPPPPSPQSRPPSRSTSAAASAAA